MSSTVPRSMPSTKNGAVSPRSPNADLAMSKHLANAARRMASNNSPPFEPRVKRRRPSTLLDHHLERRGRYLVEALRFNHQTGARRLSCAFADLLIGGSARRIEQRARSTMPRRVRHTATARAFGARGRCVRPPAMARWRRERCRGRRRP